MSVFCEGGLDVLSRNGIESQRARDAWHRALNHRIGEFSAFELARAEAIAHADDAEVSRLNAIANPFERRKHPRVDNGQVAAVVDQLLEGLRA